MSITGGIPLSGRSPLEGAHIVYGFGASTPAVPGEQAPRERRHWTRVKVGGQFYKWFNGEEPPVSLDRIDEPEWASADPEGWRRAVAELKAHVVKSLQR